MGKKSGPMTNQTKGFSLSEARPQCNGKFDIFLKILLLLKKAFILIVISPNFLNKFVSVRVRFSHLAMEL